jgi:hypothetical protein
MIIYIKKYLLSILLILFFVPASYCKVVVFDHVTTIQKPINIKVLTKAGFFTAGGRMVDIYLDNKPLKKILTGGDGYGYLKYIPQETGLKKITAHSVKGSASGLILVMTENEKAILFEIEGAFKDSVFSDAIRERSQKAVNALSENYKIIYLSRFLGKALTGNWLEKRNFPKSVILRWQGPSTLKSLTKKGVQLHAIIGSSTVISSAKKHVENRYTFEPTKNGITVKDWEEIINHLEDSSESQSDETESPVADK